MDSRFPEVSIGDLPADEIDLQCPICLDAYGTKPEDHPVRLPCSHIVGASCIEEWIAHNPVCPSCRTQCAPAIIHHRGPAIDSFRVYMDEAQSRFEPDARDVTWANMMYGGYLGSATRGTASSLNEALQRSATDTTSTGYEEGELAHDRTLSRWGLAERFTRQRLVGGLFVRTPHVTASSRDGQGLSDSPVQDFGDRETREDTVGRSRSNSPRPHRRGSDEVEDQGLADTVTASMGLEPPRRHRQDLLSSRRPTTYDDTVGRQRDYLSRTYLTGPRRRITTYTDANESGMPEIVHADPTERRASIFRPRRQR